MTFLKHDHLVLNGAFQQTNQLQVYSGLTEKTEMGVRMLPASQAIKVKIPTSEAKSRAFIAKLANANAARIAAGGVAMVLVLMNADGAAAQSQAANLSVSGMEGVASVAVRADGSALVTLENGSTVVLPAGSFTQTATGDVLVSEGIATQISAAVEAAGEASVGVAAVVAPVGVLGALAAGGGGGSSGEAQTPSQPVTTSGTVIDGYLVGATVFRDLNDNGSLDADSEPNTLTDAQGDWTLPVDPANEGAKLISFGGTDSSTGKPFTGVLTAPAGSTVVTPLTTLVQSYVDAQAAAGTTIDPATAASSLATALGLSGKDLLTLDPIAEIETGGGTADAYQAAAQVASVINAAAAAATGDGSAESSNVAAKLAAELISAEAATPGTGADALSNPTVIQQALAAGGVSGENAAKIGEEVGKANTLISNAGGEGKTAAEIQSEVAKVQEVVQGDLVESIKADDGSLDTIDVTEKAEALVALRPVVTDATATFGPADLAEGLAVTGTGRPGSTVKVSIDGTDKTVTVAENGSWTVSFAQADLPDADGTYAVEARGQAAGTSVFTTPASGGSLSVDLSAPALSFTAFDTASISLLDQLEGITINGKSEAGATVVVTFGGVETEVLADGAGNFSATFEGSANTGATSAAFSAVAADAFGNTTAPLNATVALQPISALTPTVAAIPATLDAQDAAGGLTLTGTGLVGSTISISVTSSDAGAPFTAETAVVMDGTWSFEVPATAGILTVDGSYAVSVAASLAEGALVSAQVSAGTTVVDVTAPADATDVVAAVDNLLSLEEREGSVTITGKAEAGSTVAVKIGALTETATAGADGVFSATFAAEDLPLANAVATVETTVTDAAGNSGATTQASLAIEPLSALIPTINTVAQTLGQTGLNNGLTVTGTGRAGSTVTVTIDGVQKSVLLDGTTDWSIDFATADLPADTGTYDVSFSAAVAGTAIATDTLPGGTLEIDLTAPDGPEIDPITNDDVLDAKEIQSDLVITGSAAANSVVTVTLGGETVTDEVGSDGLFSVTFTADQIADLPADAAVTAFSTDALDNVSATTSRSFAVTPPIVGTAGIDALFGTDNNDVFQLRTEGETRASAGDDEYDLTDPAIEYQGVNYGYLDQAITADIDMRDGAESTILKGSLGTDTVLDAGNTGDFGFGIVTTVEDDTITVQQNTSKFTYSGIYYVGGDDTINVTLGGYGTTRLQLQEASSADVDLGAGTAQVLNEDGTVSDLTINITPSSDPNVFGRIEVEGTDGDDVLVGSDGNDRFIGRGGDDSIDGGEGSDLVRYDRAPVGDGVFIELGDFGQVLGTWNGESFRHQLTSIEEARGSAGNDLMIAGQDGSFLRGMDGDDTLFGDIGNDSFRGDAGADVFVVGEGFDFIADFTIGVDRLALEDIVFPEDLFGEIEFGTDQNGNAFMTHTALFGSVAFGGGVTAAQLQAAADAGTLFYEPPAPTNSITGTAGNDTLEGTDADDLITAVGRADGSFGEDVIIGSKGDDFFDLSGLGDTDYVEFDYSGFAGNGIVLDFSFEMTTGGEDISEGVVLKIGEGLDRISEIGAPDDGIGIVGTARNDSLFFEYNSPEYQWVGYRHTGGDDEISIERDLDTFSVFGIFRLSIGQDGSDITADLNEGYLSSDSGSITLNEDIDGSSDNFDRPMWEVRTYNGDDNIKGSDSGDRFILGGGDDTVDGRGGFDTVRYDRNEVSGGVTVDLGQGTATGTWSGETFNHTLISIENIRASSGNDVIIGSDGDDTLDGRAGDDTLTGGDGADLFILSGGHDVFTDFDLENDDLEDNGVDRGDPAFTELQYEGVTSVKVTFGADANASVTLKGIDLASLEQWLVESEYGDVVTPAGLDDPMIGTFYGVDLFGEDPLDDISLESFTPTQIVVSKTTDLGVLTSTLTGTGFELDETGEPIAGQLQEFTVELDGNPVLELENINYPLADFVDELTNDGTIARDVLITGTPGPDALGFPAQRVWIDSGDGDDTAVAVEGSDTGIAAGDGSDAIVIEQSNAFDQTFVFIDLSDSGVDMIDGFRITNTPDTGDQLLFNGGDDSRSHFAIGLGDTSEAALQSIVSSWEPWMGADVNLGLFSDTNGNGALFEIDTSGDTPVLGDMVAEFTNLDTTDWDPNQGGAYDSIINFVDDLPQLPEVA
jgi:hypothetical protein